MQRVRQSFWIASAIKLAGSAERFQHARRDETDVEEVMRELEKDARSLALVCDAASRPEARPLLNELFSAHLAGPSEDA